MLCFGQRVSELISPFLKVLEMCQFCGHDLEFQIASCKPERDDHGAECNHSTQPGYDLAWVHGPTHDLRLQRTLRPCWPEVQPKSLAHLIISEPWNARVCLG